MTMGNDVDGFNTASGVIIGQNLTDGPSRRIMPTDYSIAVRPGTGSDTW
jgi:hypothetical protein